MRYPRLFFSSYSVVNGLVIVGSILLCFLLSLSRLPGMELLGIGPNWVLIWLVTWSLTHSRFQALVAAIFLGLVLDGMTSSYPSHLFGLLAVAWLTTQPRKKTKHDVISSLGIILVMLRVFILVLLVEGLIAIQYFCLNFSFFNELWLNYQNIALSGALLSSLWTPLLYYPLSKWWNNPSKY